MDSETLKIIKENFQILSDLGLPLSTIKKLNLRSYVERFQRTIEGKRVSLYRWKPELVEKIRQTITENMNVSDVEQDTKISEVETNGNQANVIHTMDSNEMNVNEENPKKTILVSNAVDDILDLPETLKDIGFERRNEEIVFNYKDISKLEYLLHLSPNNLCLRGPSEHQGCYLIQLAVDKGTDKYKIGRSGNLLKRLNSTEYRNAYIYNVMYVNDEKECEKKLITTFKTKFIIVNQSVDGSYGRELFRGNIIEMIKEFMNVCLEYVH